MGFASGFVTGLASSVDKAVKDDIERTEDFLDRAVDYGLKRREKAQLERQKKKETMRETLETINGITGDASLTKALVDEYESPTAALAAVQNAGPDSAKMLRDLKPLLLGETGTKVNFKNIVNRYASPVEPVDDIEGISQAMPGSLLTAFGDKEELYRNRMSRANAAYGLDAPQNAELKDYVMTNVKDKDLLRTLMDPVQDPYKVGIGMISTAETIENEEAANSLRVKGNALLALARKEEALKEGPADPMTITEARGVANDLDATASAALGIESEWDQRTQRYRWPPERQREGSVIRERNRENASVIDYVSTELGLSPIAVNAYVHQLAQQNQGYIVDMDGYYEGAPISSVLIPVEGRKMYTERPIFTGPSEEGEDDLETTTDTGGPVETEGAPVVEQPEATDGAEITPPPNPVEDAVRRHNEAKEAGNEGEADVAFNQLVRRLTSTGEYNQAEALEEAKRLTGR